MNLIKYEPNNEKLEDDDIQNDLGCFNISCKKASEVHWPDRQMDLSEPVMSSAGRCGVAAAAGCYVPGKAFDSLPVGLKKTGGE